MSPFSAQRQAVSVEFDVNFPILTEILSKIEGMTEFNETKLQLKFATDDELSDGTRRYFTKNMKSVMLAIDEELTTQLCDYWTNFKAQSNGMFAIHTILVLWKAVHDPMYESMTLDEQNVLKWACLLHDISKRGTPTIQGRDFMHSFNSAATTLKVLREMGIWSVDEDQMSDLEQVIRLIGESVQPLPAIWREDFKHGRPMVTTMQSHHNLQEIFYYLWDKGLTPRDSLADQIFRVVLFHHSIEAMEAHPNMVNLSSSEKSKWCDDQFFKMCQVL